MIDLCLETDFWRTERVCAWELNVKGEYSTFIAFSIVSLSCDAKMGRGVGGRIYGDPCGPRMVARQRMMSLSSIGLALERVVSKSTSP